MRLRLKWKWGLAEWAEWAASAVAAAKRGPQRGIAHHRSADTCQRQRGLGGHHPASHSPRLPAPDINHCIRETMHKMAPTRAMKNYWRCRSGARGGVEGWREGGDLVPFYLHQARRLVTFTREKERGRGEHDSEKGHQVKWGKKGEKAEEKIGCKVGGHIDKLTVEIALMRWQGCVPSERNFWY